MDRRKVNGYASRTERVVENALFKLGTPLFIMGLLSLVMFFLSDMHTDIKFGQRQIQQNVTDIALTGKDIQRLGDDTKQQAAWLRSVSERVRLYHERVTRNTE